MSQPVSLDDIVDIVATHEPVSPDDVVEQLDSEEIDVEQIENLLSVAIDRDRVLKVNGNCWVMRVGKYADDV